MGRLTHPGKTLEFVESKALVYEDWSRDHGYPAAPRYDGKLIKVLCSLVYVWLPGRSPSICVQDAVLRLEIRPDQAVPGCADCEYIEIWFDEHSRQGPFVEGGAWEIVLTEDGRLYKAVRPELVVDG